LVLKLIKKTTNHPSSSHAAVVSAVAVGEAVALSEGATTASTTAEISGGRIEATGGFMAGLEQPLSEEASGIAASTSSITGVSTNATTL
jgi:hypothetical protein